MRGLVGKVMGLKQKICRHGYFRCLQILVSRMRLELTRTNVHYPLKVARLPIPPPRHFRQGRIKPCGAKNGTRTRDPDLGKVVLYQLSYFRKWKLIGASHHLLVVINQRTLFRFERKTGLEPATPTLARSCSTN